MSKTRAIQFTVSPSPSGASSNTSTSIYTVPNRADCAVINALIMVGANNQADEVTSTISINGTPVWGETLSGSGRKYHRLSGIVLKRNDTISVETTNHLRNAFINISVHGFEETF